MVHGVCVLCEQIGKDRKMIKEFITIAIVSDDYDVKNSGREELIRCKDCKYRNQYRFPPKYDKKDYCDYHEKCIDIDNFCAWAERKEE